MEITFLWQLDLQSDNFSEHKTCDQRSNYFFAFNLIRAMRDALNQKKKDGNSITFLKIFEMETRRSPQKIGTWIMFWTSYLELTAT